MTRQPAGGSPTRFWKRLAALAAVALAAGASETRGQESTDSVERLTGGHTRVVWVQDQSPSQRDSLARERRLVLMAYDSRDGAGERRIVAAERNFAKPLLTPDGTRVIWSDHFADRAYVVNWDGSGRRTLGEGFALDVWADPTTGTQWVYLASRAAPKENYVYHKVRRIQLDNPRIREPVWDKTDVSPDNFQLSADGTRAAGEFPWPNAGVATLPNGTLTRLADGCWASLAPDNSYLCSVFDGAHRNLRLFHDPPADPRVVPLAGIEALGGHEAFHPRWTNHARWLVLTGPYMIRGPLNYITGGGPQVEVFLIKLSPAFDRIETWVQVTRNARGDFHPDAWISGGDQSLVTLPRLAARQTNGAAWPAERGGLAFAWKNANTQNDLGANAADSPAFCTVDPRGGARFDRHFAMDCRDGWFTASPPGNPAEACRAAGTLTLELLVTPPEQPPRKAARVFEYSRDAGGFNMALEQTQRKFVARVQAQRAASVVEATCSFGDLPTRPNHLVLAFTPAGLEAWVDGRPVQTAQQAELTLEPWSAGRLNFGANALGEQRWEGRVEYVALWTRPLRREEIARQYEPVAASVGQRRSTEQVRLRARLVQATDGFDAASILPYRRALVVHRYQVETVLAGRVATDQVLAARWGIMDGHAISNALDPPGRSVELLLERFEDHPELAGERQLVDVETGDLPLYYDVGTRPAPGPASRQNSAGAAKGPR